MKDLRLWANYYYNMGFNVTHIIPHLNEGKAKNPYKSPTNDRNLLKNRRQTIEELNSYDWEHSTGIGIVLGFNNLRAIDFDFYVEFKRMYPPQPPDYIDKSYFSSKKQFIEEALNLLGLPSDYEWVVNTPNNGFHIIVFSENHKFQIKENLTKSFTPNVITHDSVSLKHIELRWDKHLVLPPSKNNESKNYLFTNSNFPKKIPLAINDFGLSNMLNEFCYDEYDHNLKSGYNLHLSNYYDDSNEESIKFYAEGEFLDLSPVYFKKDENNSIPDGWLK